MLPTVKPSDIKAEIERVSREITGLLMYRETLEHALKASMQLTRTGKARSVSTVQVNSPGLSGYTKRAATRSNREHEGLRILYEHDITQSALARELKESRSRVASWFAEGELNRPIPRVIAQHLQAKYGVPLSAWSRIAG